MPHGADAGEAVWRAKRKMMKRSLTRRSRKAPGEVRIQQEAGVAVGLQERWKTDYAPNPCTRLGLDGVVLESTQRPGAVARYVAEVQWASPSLSREAALLGEGESDRAGCDPDGDAASHGRGRSCLGMLWWLNG